MYQQITIKTLKKQGSKNIEIASELHCHRNTVRNILGKENIQKSQTRDKSSYFDDYREKISELLGKKITRLRIFEILNEEYGLTRTYDSLCKYIQITFPTPKKAFGVQSPDPGEDAEIDFGYLGMFPGPGGILVKTYVLLVVLAYSRKLYGEILYDQKASSLLGVMERAFNSYGGVPKRVKVDNMKSAILRNQHYNLEFNPDFLNLSAHYGFVIKPCTPYSPNQKGKIEAGIKYVEINFIQGRCFKDEADIKYQFTQWLDKANARIHGTTKKVPNLVFIEEEKLTLLPLPENLFSIWERTTRTIPSNGHIHFENNYYSVPNRLVGKTVSLFFKDHILRVLFDGSEVALHQIVSGSGMYITVRSHMPDWRVYSETEYQLRYEQKMLDIGVSAHTYFKELLISKGGHWSRSVRYILGMKEEFGSEALELSLQRALVFKVQDTKQIRTILEKKLYLLDISPKLKLVSEETDSSIMRDPRYYSLEKINYPNSNQS